MINPAVNSDFPPGTNDFAHYRAEDLGDADFKVEAFLHLSIAGTTVVTGNRSINGTLTRVRQYQTIDGLTEVAEIGTRVLRVEVSRFADIESGSDGLFRRKADASPIVSYLIEDPTPTDANDKALRFTETRGVVTRSTSYIFNATGAYWEITRSGQSGAIRFSTSTTPLSKTTVWLNGNSDILRERRVTVDVAGKTLSIKSGNLSGPTPLVEEQYTYATGNDSPAFVRHLMDGATVDWTRTIRLGHEVTTIRPYLDAPTLPINPLDPNNDDLFLNQGSVTESVLGDIIQNKPSGGTATKVSDETIYTSFVDYPGSPDPNNPWKMQVERRTRLSSAFGPCRNDRPGSAWLPAA